MSATVKIFFRREDATYSAKDATENTQSNDSQRNNLLKSVAEYIRIKNFTSAREQLKLFMSIDMENPEAYNLLGISYEMEGDRIKASKFYIVAYYMDQTFKASSDNLDRVCQVWYKGCCDVSWGLDFREVKI